MILQNFSFSDASKYTMVFPDGWQSDFLLHFPWNAKSHSLCLSTDSSNMGLFGVTNKCKLCSSRVKRQDHPELHWGRPFHRCTPNLLSALYPQERLLLLFPAHPFSGGCFFEISVWTVEQKKRQEHLILGGRNFVLTLKMENCSKQQTWENSKCSLP